MMTTQRATNRAAENALVITKKGTSLLSKQQQTFNKLTQKIKKLRGEIKIFIEFNDDCLAYYSAHIYPLEQQSVALRTEITKLLYAIYCNDKSISKNDRKTLKQVMLLQIDDVFCANENHDNELKEIFNAISGENYEQVARSEFDEAVSEMETMFSSMGIDLDMSHIGKDDDMATMMRKMQEQLENAKAKMASEPPKERKTKKEIAREKKEKALETVREQSLKNIYKQLVKALHPDLERDEAVRQEKEAVMQELTTAYKNNDLHTLLKLELNWIQRESNHLETLTDDKLSIYNQLLKEQIKEMEEELTMLGHHPRYAPLERFYSNDYLYKDTLYAQPALLKELISDVETSIFNLKNGKSKMEIAGIIASYHLQVKMSRQPHFSWDDL
jgi:hypothetical protein